MLKSKKDIVQNNKTEKSTMSAFSSYHMCIYIQVKKNPIKEDGIAGLFEWPGVSFHFL